MTVRSWRSMCEEADPDFWKARRHEVAYEFSNGRRFYARYPDPYATSTATSSS